VWHSTITMIVTGVAQYYYNDHNCDVAQYYYDHNCGVAQYY